MDNILEMKSIVKKYKGFELNIPEFNVPSGFAVALIGENGAGKTTLLDIMSGITLDFKGETKYFGQYDTVDCDIVREKIGYTAPTSYYLKHWKIADTAVVNKLLFESFSEEKFFTLCEKLSLKNEKRGFKAAVSQLSDGSKMRLMLAGVFARETDLLIMDEPASPLDPLMRDTLCDMIREYLDEGKGEKSVVYSTHNISDMENVTDYAVIISGGRIAEQGFVEELKEKYICVKGEKSCAEKAKPFMYTFSENSYGFEGIILSKDLDRLAGMDVKAETPSLHQISTAVMKRYAG